MGYVYLFFFEGFVYEDVWVICKKGFGLMLGIKGNKKFLVFIEDVGIFIEYLFEYIDWVLKFCVVNGMEVVMYVYVSVGVIYV